MYVEVAVNLPPVRGTFDYHLPPSLRGKVVPGSLVIVPFGRRRVQGVVTRALDKPTVEKTKPIEKLVDPRPVLNPTQLQLAAWLAKETYSPLIDCLTIMIPPGLSQQADTLYSLIDTEHEGETTTEKRLLSLLQKRGPLRGRQIARALPHHNWRKAVEALERQGAIEHEMFLPRPSARARRVRTARLAVPPEQARRAFDDLGRRGYDARRRRRIILERLIEKSEPQEVGWLYLESDGNISDLRYLEQRGLIVLGEAELWRDPTESIDFVPVEPPRLTSDQAAVWEPIRDALEGPAAALSSPFLLHGVTGSGKTEIYLRAVAQTLARGRSAIVLVPEIALTPQTVRRFLARFPGRVGLIHSQLSEGERYDTWRRSRSGRIDVVVGPRSALFTPLPDIGLIVVDECHDDSYKQHHRTPRYHAREAAMAYAGMLDAVCILGSATPDVETAFKASEGEIQHLSLPKRILGHTTRLTQQAHRLGVTPRYQRFEGQAESIELPPVRVVDMRHELKAGNRSMFSRPLQQALSKTLQAEQQAILFLNRRGASTHVFCRDCGWVARCPRCETPLAYHSARERLLCHHCGYSRRNVHTCPECGGERVRHFGAGTQQVQDELERVSPDARLLRWDWDVTRTKGAHEQILSAFASRRADVLIGTQMIAKGLDLPLVTLVGVISADTGLHLPDFRAAERTFQVLTQVAGRAGRGLLGGQVMLQTYHPEHYAIRAASGHDYEAFYHDELEHRRELRYPPFTRLARLLYRHPAANSAREEAERMFAALQNHITSLGARFDAIGPVPCFFRKIRGRYRWQIVLRSPDPTKILPESFPEGWRVDIDPVSLL
jgi:primosomal protein N' (replication factor Y)